MNWKIVTFAVFRFFIINLFLWMNVWYFYVNATTLAGRWFNDDYPSPWFGMFLHGVVILMMVKCLIEWIKDVSNQIQESKSR